jgi:hypothetical protein
MLRVIRQLWVFSRFISEIQSSPAAPGYRYKRKTSRTRWRSQRNPRCLVQTAANASTLKIALLFPPGVARCARLHGVGGSNPPLAISRYYQRPARAYSGRQARFYFRLAPFYRRDWPGRLGQRGTECRSRPGGQHGLTERRNGRPARRIELNNTSPAPAERDCGGRILFTGQPVH